MDKLKVKTIGVLKEREDKANNGEDDCVAKQQTGAATTNAPAAVGSRQGAVKMSAMDISGILNCSRRLEWTKEWIRKNQHEFLNKENLRKELLFRSNERYHLNYFFNITEKQFRYLVKILEPLVTVLEPQRKRKTFSAEERIAITLKYLATGEVNSCRNYCFRASKPVILKMIADICQKMYELLKDQYVYLPRTSEQWIPIINGMQHKRHISNCLGGLIMQEITFYTPPNQTSRPRGQLWNADEDKSCAQKPPLILTAIVDDSYNFLYVDVDKTKAQFYDEIFEKSPIRKLLEDGTITIPTSIKKANGACEPCAFAGNNCLPDKPYLKSKLQPTTAEAMESDANFREAKDTLCMLCNIFPVLGQPLRLCESDAQKIIMGSIALFNYLRKSDIDYCKLTQTIITGPDDELESFEDDDCIFVESDDDRKERYEFTPNIHDSTCFKPLRIQRGDLPAGLEWGNKQLSKQFASLLNTTK